LVLKSNSQSQKKAPVKGPCTLLFESTNYLWDERCHRPLLTGWWSGVYKFELSKAIDAQATPEHFSDPLRYLSCAWRNCAAGCAG